MKRRRLVFVCLNCKKRRVKCDKGNPCSNCVKSGKNCVYSDEVTNGKSYVLSTFQPLDLKIKSPLGQNSIQHGGTEIASTKNRDTTGIYSAKPSSSGGTSESSGSVPVDSVDKQIPNPDSEATVDEFSSVDGKDSIIRYEEEGEIPGKETSFFDTVKVSLTQYDSSPYSLKSFIGFNTTFRTFHNSIPFLLQNLHTPSSTSVPPKDEEFLSLDDRLISVLPPQQYFWQLLDKFFATIHPEFPFVIREEFFDDLNPIIGSTDDKISLNIRTNEDYLTIMLALVFISLASIPIMTRKILPNQESLHTEAELKRCLKHSPDIVSVVNSCIKSLPESMNFKTFQVLNFLRIYHRYSPEYDAKEMVIISERIIELGEKLGILYNTNELLTVNEFKLGLRMIIYFSICESCHVPLSARQFPGILRVLPFTVQFSDIAINHVDNDDTVKFLHCCTRLWNEVLPKIVQVPDLFSNPNLPISVFIKRISDVELSVQDHSKLFKFYLNDESNKKTITDYNKFVGKNSMGKFVLSYNLFFTLNFNIILQFQEKGYSSFFYKLKLLKKVYECLKSFPPLIQRSNMENDFIINPTLQVLVFRIYLILIDLYIQFGSYLKSEQIMDLTSRVKLTEVTSSLRFQIRYLIYLLYFFVPNYSYAWKAFKLAKIYYRNLEKSLSDSITDTDFDDPTYAIERLDLLISIIDIPILFDEYDFDMDSVDQYDDKWSDGSDIFEDLNLIQ
ncbi:hypothetical protein CLIB1444_02S12860 [[Candida] jaroonii]|uniref:Uncharacterized protein n=1 Tax=[Candida] jaroonii TaxID=467808 RepID=A0ACA9Y3X0_9ASCO|nr:hypothetical protein CLIB1444_02S12860 [[Candida] jaroonii]